MTEDRIIKYPRTPHIEGSKLQPGDNADGQMSIAKLREMYPDATFVSEEKLDGANTGLFVNRDLELNLQSRGHVLRGGAREGQFNLFKQWACHHEAALLERFEDRYRPYHEWTFARHTQFYDRLPHFLHEFDIWDMKDQIWLSTPRRHALLEGLPVVSVPVISTEWPRDRRQMAAMVGPSLYRSETWRDSLVTQAERAGVDPEAALAEAGAGKPDADLAEGIYIKIEDSDQVLARFKFVRSGFLQTILESGSHWHERPIIQNVLREDVDLFPAVDGPGW
ncbi:hypothetical protein OCH239_09740 [Roseivivax halodurans JCM 10272]|uniref:RNA ligase domain-containing protein n=1 Tax=Roseivivax halodurans JCM 10272 TaxID=1449350 RepID=X7EEB2_9RHOB|nr:RNA ligase family protein [Roseivivax halodurans]ETX13551.1 hypothetical protein OCH239_09740 [Roseivivax halodurans JCM 10272]